MRMLGLCCLWLWLVCWRDVVMGASADPSQKQLDMTPSWAVAGVCAVIIVISILLETSLHKLATWFTDNQKRAMYEALLKVKAELMVLGFISLLLNFGQAYIIKICIPENVALTMLPCAYAKDDETKEEEQHRRRLLWLERRQLASAAPIKCKELYELGHLIMYRSFKIQTYS